jgi:hypothetical protein
MLFALTAVFAACSLDVEPEVQDASRFVRAKVNGQDWEVLGSRAALLVSSTAAFIVGANVNNSSIVLTLRGVNKVGVYSVRSSGSPGVEAGVTTSSRYTYVADSVGTVTITELTANRVSGTFSFVASFTANAPPATHTVTDGAFSVPIDPPGAIPIVP